MDSTFIIVITTCSNPQDAKRLTEGLLNRNLAACIQHDEINSTYRWQGQIETASEVRLMIKTRRALFDEIAVVIRQSSRYETPEIIAIPISQGNPDYLQWIDAETAQS